MAPRLGIVVLVLVAALSAATFLLRSSRHPTPPLANETPALIPLDEIVEGGPGKDGIPSIDRPTFRSVPDTDRDGLLDPNGLGMSVSLGSTTRFYPFQILVWHEIVNDTIEGRPVLVTFCPLCGTGIAYERTIDGAAVTFGVSGKLYNSDLLMYDRKTETLWSQLDGRAVVGPLTGKRLTLLDAPNLTWGEFRRLHPDGKVLSTETGYDRDYRRSPYGDYDTSPDVFFPVGHTDGRLPAKTRVIGVELDGRFKAYSVDLLQRQTSTQDTVGSTAITLEARNGRIEVHDGRGKSLIPVYSFWFAWVAFHPETELYSDSS